MNSLNPNPVSLRYSLPRLLLWGLVAFLIGKKSPNSKRLWRRLQPLWISVNHESWRPFRLFETRRSSP